MADIRADRRGAGEAHLGVHVRAVHVHLPAVHVDDLADLTDRLLEDTVGARVRDHEAGECCLVLLGLGPQVGEVDVPLLIAGYGHDPQARDDRAGGVGPVGRFRDQADITPRIAAALVIGMDHAQPGVLALAARVGLEADGGEPGDLAEPRFEIAIESGVAALLVRGGEGVNLSELAPRHGDHLACGVEFHRARAQRDHRVRQRQVPPLQTEHVPQHLVLAVVALEDRVREVGAGPGRPRGQRPRLGERSLARSIAGDGRDHRRQVRPGRRLVEAHADGAVAEVSQVDARGAGRVEHVPRASLQGTQPQRIEKDAGLDLARTGHAPRQRPREAADALGDPAKPPRPVVRRVHAGDDRQQRLRGADVARGLLTLDVLLAGLDRHSEGGVPQRIARDADDAPRHLADELGARGDERSVRPARAHRHAEPLGAAHGDVSPQFARRGEQREGQQVGGHHHQRPRLVNRLHQRTVIVGRSRGIGILHQHPADLIGIREQHVGLGRGRGLAAQRGGHGHDAKVQPHRLRPGLHHRQRLRVAVVRRQERCPPLAHRSAHRHRFRRGGRLIEQARAGQGQARQVRHHGLEVEQGLEPSLGDLGLVRRVLGVPPRIFEDVA